MERIYVTAYPSLIAEWSPTNELKPEQVTSGSHKIIRWVGKCGHEWEAIVKNRVKGSGCPICSGNRVQAGTNDLSFRMPELVCEWSEKNRPLMPEQFTCGSNRTVWWKGSCGHEWQARIADRVEGHGCPYCAGKVCPGETDLASTHPELMQEWSEKNDFSPRSVTAKSTRMAWWKCKTCGYEWQAEIRTKVRGTMCPDCRKRMTEQRYIDFLTERRRIRRARYELPPASFLYYLSQTDIPVFLNDDSRTGIPFQFYLPELSVAVEFTGRNHKTKAYRQRAVIQNDLCLRKRIRLVRILESGEPEYRNCFCITRKDCSPDTLSEALRVLFLLLHQKLSIDVARDRDRIQKETEVGNYRF